MKLQHPTRPVGNVVITTKGLQQRTQRDDGEKGNSNLILIEIYYPDVVSVIKIMRIEMKDFFTK